MANLIYIFLDIILPILILIIMGVVLQRAFKLDINTLIKIHIYLFSPALIFSKLYESELALSLFFTVILFTLLFVCVLRLISYLIAKLLKLDRKKGLTFAQSVMFYNSANFGIPVNDLVFKSDPFAMSVQIAVVAFQNTMVFSYGIFALNSMDKGKLKAMLAYFKMPLFYAMTLGLVLNYFDVSLPNFIAVPVSYSSDALIALALVILGAQIAHIKFNFHYLPLYVSLITRLLIGPTIAFGLILMFGFEGIFAQALLISTAMPTAVISSIIAQEYNNEPEFAAQTVIVSTFLSSITLTFVIYMAFLLF